MLKRILILGVAAVALALVAPVIGLGGGVGVGGEVAHAQTDPNADVPDSGDAPDAPDSGDTTDTPDTPDSGDTSDDGGDSGGDAEDGACPSSGARASGDSCPPPAERPAPEARAPQSAPTSGPESGKSHESGGGSSSKGESARSPVTPQFVQQTTPVSAGVDTGTIPTGGIQAGAGGTAEEGSIAGLLWGSGLLLVLAAGALTVRRRDGLGS